MTTTPFQPELPPEGAWTDAELNFVDESPPGLYPENQDSNYGLLRKIFTDRIQELIEQQLTIYNERFVPTSTEFIGEWERDYALPVAPTNRTLAQRRQDVMGRISKGWFSRPRREKIVEAFIQATFGTEIQLTPPGVALVPGGVPLYSEAVDVKSLYSIRENTSSGHNMLPSGNFEVDTTGWGAGNATLSRDTSVSKAGAASLKVSPTADPVNVFGPAPAISGATAGRVFTVSCWFYGAGSAIGKTVRLQFNETGGATVQEGVVATDVILVAGWQKLVCTGTVVRNDRTGLPVIVTLLGTGWTGIPVWLDAVQLEESPYATPYVDAAKTPYYYEVRIKNTITPDMVGLIRELTRVTPAGISFDVLTVAEVDAAQNYIINPTLDNSLDYWKLVALSGSSGTLTTGKFGIANDNVGRVYANPGSGPNLAAQTILYGLLAGRKYRFSAWVYNDPGMQMWVHFSSSKRDVNMVNSALIAGDWQQITFDFTALSGESQVTLQLVVGANYQNKSFYFDDVFVMEV